MFYGTIVLKYDPWKKIDIQMILGKFLPCTFFLIQNVAYNIKDPEKSLFLSTHSTLLIESIFPKLYSTECELSKLNFTLRCCGLALAIVAQLVGVCSCQLKGYGFHSQSARSIPRLWFWSWSRSIWEVNEGCFSLISTSLSLSPSFRLSLKSISMSLVED